MGSVELFLVAIAAVFVIGAAGELVFQRTQIPDVLWLIAVGVLVGPVGGLVTREQLSQIAPYFAAITLVVVLFEGGSNLRLSDVSRAAPRSTLLALLTFGASAALVAVAAQAARAAGWLPPGWTWTHGALLGCILGGSSSIIVMPAMAVARVPARVANLVGLESAFTDAFCVVGAATLIEVLSAAHGIAPSPGAALARAFGLGAGLGVIAGLGWLFVLRVLRASEHAYTMTLAALFVLYVAIQAAGGSAALGILAFGLVVGNADAIGRRVGYARRLDLGRLVRGLHGEVTFMVKSFFFTFLGAMMGPPWTPFALGLAFGPLLLAARAPMVALVMAGRGFDGADRGIATLAVPRGMAAGVLATLPAAAGIPGTEALPALVFACVLSTIVLFAIGFPLARRGAAAGGEADAEAAPATGAAGAAAPGGEDPR
uniref:Cation/H+ exchanger transmembrane domain-containing protein n=1 Tax=Eiseniibacteriota bacterium TaxID=2212470 RepID=A0A832MM56_UNCEI